MSETGIVSTEIPGAVYTWPHSAPEGTPGTLQPGCIICHGTIPEKQAKLRAKTCSIDCTNTLRRIRYKNQLGTEQLRCQVCRGIIPPASAKKFAVVCGTDCRNEMRRYRFMILKNTKCPHCYHPSTPEEWEEYRQWRASKGHLQAFVKPGRGNMAAKREKELREALAEAVEVFKEQRDSLVKHSCLCVEGVPDLATMDKLAKDAVAEETERIDRFEELLKRNKKHEQ